MITACNEIRDAVDTDGGGRVSRTSKYEDYDICDERRWIDFWMTVSVGAMRFGSMLD